MPEAFWSKCTPEPNSGCWLWHGSQDSHGYGQIRSNYVLSPAHRVSVEKTVGAIPDGKWVDHLCRTPCCVNPAHLDIVTPGENIRRGDLPKLKKERAKMATHCRNGHLWNPETTKITPTQRKCLVCVKTYDARRKKG